MLKRALYIKSLPNLLEEKYYCGVGVIVGNLHCAVGNDDPERDRYRIQLLRVYLLHEHDQELDAYRDPLQQVIFFLEKIVRLLRIGHYGGEANASQTKHR